MGELDGVTELRYGAANASRGWEWLVQGWVNFLRSPGIWVSVALLYLAVYFVLAWVPLLGQLAALALGPALAAGLIYGAREVDAGRELTALHLFQAFRLRPVAGPMLLLGFVPTAVGLLGAVVTIVLLGGVGVGVMFGSNEAGLGVFVALLSTVLLWLIVLTVVAAALFYAIPLVIFDSVPPLRAARASIAATGRNLAPLSVFGFLWTLLSLAAALTFGVGFLLLIPVTAGAAYASYREVFIDARPAELAA